MPTYPAELVQVTMAHSLSNGPETVINTFHLQHRHYDGNSFDWANALPTIATKCRDAWEALTIFTYLSTGFRFQWAKASQIGTDGKVTRTAVANSTITGGKPGTNSNPALPYEVSAVASIRTDVAGAVVSNPRTGPNPSRQRRGRIYLGGFTTDLMDPAANGLFLGSSITNIGGQIRAFFNNVQGVNVGGPTAPNPSADYMKFGVASGVSGEFYQAERILMDLVPDAQRRRRNRQKQAGYSGTITHAE